MTTPFSFLSSPSILVERVMLELKPIEICVKSVLWLCPLSDIKYIRVAGFDKFCSFQLVGFIGF
jgi:hypothetical protein